MGRLELDKWDLKRLYELKLKGRLELQPEYQRGKVWDDPRRYDLVDTVIREWPMGLILLRAYPQESTDGHTIEYYDVVDGQQRLTSLFEYFGGTSKWIQKVPTKHRGSFRQYSDLSEPKQEKVDEYKVSVAFMRDYDEAEILDIYSRLQTGKPLNIGEKVKAFRSDIKDLIKELSGHRLFTLDAHKFRDANWNLATQFLKAVYVNDPLTRVEIQELQTFLQHTELDKRKASKTKDRASSIMTYEFKVLNEAIDIKKEFENTISSARILKWLFAVLMQLIGVYSLTGREHLVAQGIIEYYDRKDQENSPEWTAYMRTGRTGRMDTDDVKVCLNQLSAYIISESGAQPTDPQRWFTPEQRQEIWDKSGGKCQSCGMQLSRTNFHADHINPHSNGGPTTTENGQALCVECNIKKGADALFK